MAVHVKHRSDDNLRAIDPFKRLEQFHKITGNAAILLNREDLMIEGDTHEKGRISLFYRIEEVSSATMWQYSRMKSWNRSSAWASLRGARPATSRSAAAAASGSRGSKKEARSSACFR